MVDGLPEKVLCGGEGEIIGLEVKGPRLQFSYLFLSIMTLDNLIVPSFFSTKVGLTMHPPSGRQ